MDLLTHGVLEADEIVADGTAMVELAVVTLAPQGTIPNSPGPDRCGVLTDTLSQRFSSRSPRSASADRPAGELVPDGVIGEALGFEDVVALMPGPLLVKGVVFDML
jgi:hypothetical protein